MNFRLAVIILAAGKGRRMNNPELAKVLYAVGGRPMIDYVVERALELAPEKIIVVVGHQKDSVIDHLQKTFSSAPIAFAEQREQLGTGHAVQQAETFLKNFSGDVLILSGDVPLLSQQTLSRLINEHRAAKTSATMITADLADPTGYGRIVRAAGNSVERIVEHKDATDDERAITEINAGIYCFDARDLFSALARITPNNVQGEFYLTDVLGILSADGKIISAVQIENAGEAMGVNTPEQLEEMNRKIF